MAEADQVTKDAAPAQASTSASAAVSKPAFENLTADNNSKKENSIDLIMDVPLDVTIELGRTLMSVKDILALGVGSVIELDRMAGEPVDILVNDKLIAKGEVIVVDESFGVRITSIVSNSERANKLL